VTSDYEGREGGCRAPGPSGRVLETEDGYLVFANARSAGVTILTAVRDRRLELSGRRQPLERIRKLSPHGAQIRPFAGLRLGLPVDVDNIRTAFEKGVIRSNPQARGRGGQAGRRHRRGGRLMATAENPTRSS